MVVTVPYNVGIVFYKDGARTHSHRFSGHSNQQVLHAQIDVSRGTVSVGSRNSSLGPDGFPTTCLPVGPAGLFKHIGTRPQLPNEPIRYCKGPHSSNLHQEAASREFQNRQGHGNHSSSNQINRENYHHHDQSRSYLVPVPQPVNIFSPYLTHKQRDEICALGGHLKYPGYHTPGHCRKSKGYPAPHSQHSQVYYTAPQGQTPMEPSTSNPFLGQVPPPEVPLRPPPNVTTPQSGNTPATGKDRKEQENSRQNATTDPQADRSILPPNITSSSTATPNNATPDIASLSIGSPSPEPNTINNTYNLIFYPDSNTRGAVNFNMVGNGVSSEEINGISDKEGNGVSGGNVTKDARDDDFISAFSKRVFGRYTCVACEKDIKPMRRLNKCGHDICDKDARNIPIVWNGRCPSCRENVWDDSVDI